MNRVLFLLISAVALALLARPGMGQDPGYKMDHKQATAITPNQVFQWKLSGADTRGQPGGRWQPLLRQAGFSAAWHFNDAIGARGRNASIDVAVLDVAFGEHEELKTQFGDSSPVLKIGQMTEPKRLLAAEEGTFVAGVIAAADDRKGIKGCTPFAKLYPVAVESNLIWEGTRRTV
jgi:hypothetical protein